MIDLYAAPTINCQRVAVTLGALQLAYTVKPMVLSKGDHRAPDFVALNPAAAVPVLIDSEGPGTPLVLTQSGAILLYLAEKTGALLPAEPARRAAAYKWLMQAMTDVNGASGTIFVVSNVVPEKVPSTIDVFKTRLARFLGHCDAHLAGRDFLADEISIADMALLPLVVGNAAVVEAAGLHNLPRWAGALMERPGIAAGIAVARA